MPTEMARNQGPGKDREEEERASEENSSPSNKRHASCQVSLPDTIENVRKREGVTTV